MEHTGNELEKVRQKKRERKIRRGAYISLPILTCIYFLLIFLGLNKKLTEELTVVERAITIMSFSFKSIFLGFIAAVATYYKIVYAFVGLKKLVGKFKQPNF